MNSVPDSGSKSSDLSRFVNMTDTPLQSLFVASFFFSFFFFLAHGLIAALLFGLEMLGNDVVWRKTFDSGSFARFQVLGKEVVVRRGVELGYHYGGLKTCEREVTLGGKTHVLKTFRLVLSPPALGQTQQPVTETGQYRPEYDVLFLCGAEVMFPRRPSGFSDEEMVVLLAGWPEDGFFV